MSLKLQRLEKQIEREIAKILQEDVKADIGFVTITGVELTNDLSYARVFYTVLGADDEKRQQVQKQLERAKGFIKNTLGSRVTMRKMPELIFEYDKSLDYGERIEELIKQIKND
ncbi:MAG TPA: 30S ribosome-binding factor RbfA [Haloplasmataceae bacterium]